MPFRQKIPIAAWKFSVCFIPFGIFCIWATYDNWRYAIYEGYYSEKVAIALPAFAVLSLIMGVFPPSEQEQRDLENAKNNPNASVFEKLGTRGIIAIIAGFAAGGANAYLHYKYYHP
ncbi:MAG: hypothetical protein R3C18_17990 [Planctomycetaceae bacterium]